MNQGEEFDKFRLTIAILIYHIIIILLFIFGCWLIDNFTKILGYHDTLLSGLLNNYLDPIMMLCLFSITVSTIIKVYYTKNKSDVKPRFEMIFEDDSNIKKPLIIKANASIDRENEDVFQ